MVTAALLIACIAAFVVWELASRHHARPHTH